MLDVPAQVRQTFVKSRFGWYVHTTYGIANVGEVPIFSLTLRGAERKADRLARALTRPRESFVRVR